MSTESSPIDAKALRNALGNFATGITVITAQNAAGDKVGVTANSFNSLSMDPPLILWSLDKRAGSYEVFSSAEYFAVNVLAADQMDTSNHFATKQEDKFAGVDFETGLGGSPLLFGCAARFQCRVYQKIDAGDHWLFIGQVEKFDDQAKAALCYHKGGYSMLSPHPGTRKVNENQPSTTNEGRLNDNIFYLMLSSLQSYQQNYVPKQEALGLSNISARIVMNLSDSEAMTISMLAASVFAPNFDVEENITVLVEQGYVLSTQDDKYALTEKGKQQAEQYWSLVNHHQAELFEQFTPEAVSSFKNILKVSAKV